MAQDFALRRKLTLRARDAEGALRQVVYVKKPGETLEHVLMKAFLWALYLPAYPALTVEVPIGDRYKPDVVQLDAEGRPDFWGEAGKVSAEKYAALLRRFPHTHFAVAKWGERLDPHAAVIRRALDGRTRRAPFELLGFPADADRFITDDGEIAVRFEDVERVRIA